MNWEQTPPASRPRVQLNTKPCFSVTVADHATHRWQHFLLEFGSHSLESNEQCQQTWPREAIAEARRRLDDLESRLGPPSLDEIREQWVARIENASTQGELNQIADQIESVDGFMSYDRHFLSQKLTRRSAELAEGINPAW